MCENIRQNFSRKCIGGWSTNAFTRKKFCLKLWSRSGMSHPIPISVELKYQTKFCFRWRTESSALVAGHEFKPLPWNSNIVNFPGTLCIFIFFNISRCMSIWELLQCLCLLYEYIYVMCTLLVLSNCCVTVFHLHLKQPGSKRPALVIESNIFVLPRWPSG